MAIIKGDDLMLFDSEGKSLAFATSHVLTITANATDISSKDGGIWGDSEVTKINWEITSENLYTEDAYDKLFDSMIARTPIDVHFGIKKEVGSASQVGDGTGDLANWTKGTKHRKGKAIITSLTANANTGENATYSVTLTGKGKLEKVTGAA